jgi:hypothetical protein
VTARAPLADLLPPDNAYIVVLVAKARTTATGNVGGVIGLLPLPLTLVAVANREVLWLNVRSYPGRAEIRPGVPSKAFRRISVGRWSIGC